MLGDAGCSLKRGKHVLKAVHKQRNRPHEVPARDEILYSIEEARQRFSQWAVCRAAQAGRSPGTRQELIAAVKQCGVVEFVEKQLRTTDNADDFEKSFLGWVDGVIGYLDKERNKQIKWGVAAKLVAIYLKGAFIFNAREKSKLARLIAPPIDSILLRGIDKHFGTRLSKMPDYNGPS